MVTTGQEQYPSSHSQFQKFLGHQERQARQGRATRDRKCKRQLAQLGRKSLLTWRALGRGPPRLSKQTIPSSSFSKEGRGAAWSSYRATMSWNPAA